MDNPYGLLLFATLMGDLDAWPLLIAIMNDPYGCSLQSTFGKWDSVDAIFAIYVCIHTHVRTHVFTKEWHPFIHISLHVDIMVEQHLLHLWSYSRLGIARWRHLANKQSHYGTSITMWHPAVWWHHHNFVSCAARLQGRDDRRSEIAPLGICWWGDRDRQRHQVHKKWMWIWCKPEWVGGSFVRMLVSWISMMIIGFCLREGFVYNLDIK